MLTVARLRRKPHYFRNFTGLTPAQFDTLLAALEPHYHEREQARKARAARQRAIGAGAPFHLALPERLLMVLLYLRLYVTQPLLGYLFDLDESNVSRERNHRMLPVLLEVLPVPLRTELGLIAAAQEEPGQPQSKPRPKKISSMEALLERFPELKEVLIDSTEQPRPRPKPKGPQKDYYSGKKKRHTLKTQVTTAGKLVLHTSAHVPGSVHDLMLLRFSGILRQLPKGYTVRLDKGYEGVDAEYPQVPIQKPIKARRNHPLTPVEKAYNRMQSRLRIGVEHVLARLEQFRILAGLYRGPVGRYDEHFAVVAGLNNFRALGALAW